MRKPNSQSVEVIWCVLMIIGNLVSVGKVWSADNSGRNTKAISAIFAEEHIAESTLSVHRTASAMSPQRRFEYLARWVLPNESHDTFRLQVDFTPTQPAPPVDTETVRAGRRVNSGGRLISPALDLVDAAAEINKLDEIRGQVEQAQAKTLLTQKNRLALLAIMLLKQKKLDEALGHIDQFCELCAQEQPDDEVYRASEAVLFVSSFPYAEVSEALGPTIDRVVNRHRANLTRTIWSRRFRSLQSLRTENVAEARDESATACSQWGSFSTISGQTRGGGIPASRWRLKKGQTDNTVSHGDDYLFFAVPMRGNFQIECDVTAFNWSETRLLTGGKWVSPRHDYGSYTVGDMHNVQKNRAISPPLTKGGEKMHYRTEVRDRIATTSVEGRIIHTEQLAEDHDPWVALRNGDAQEGSAFNVRVTGNPKIPKTILLTASDNLEGWLPYYGDSAEQWQGMQPGGIQGLRTVSHEGLARVDGEARIGQTPAASAVPLTDPTYHEQALFYQRPMLEDGTIEYEFFYRENAQHAHPVIDRLCFLMDPAGVKIHWLTDGMFDRTELSPGNETIEAKNRRGPQQLPLIANSWNRASVILRGDTIDVTLNDQVVFQRVLESTNQRHFGFFYYSDQSELQVRNVRWTGNWPRDLMQVRDQELAIEEAEFLDQNAEHLTATFEHDFVKDGMSEDRMTTIHGSAQDHLKLTPDGLLALRPGNGGYQNTTIAPHLQVHGDFDITVAYDDYESAPTAGGSSSLMLIALLDNVRSDEFFITRRHMFYANGNEQQFVQCATVQKPPEGEKRDYFITKAMEERSGRLRLSRRGKQVYYLSAEGDSPNFRLRGSRELSADDIMMEGIRLVNQIHQKGNSSVVWKSIVIRAEKFSGSDAGEVDPRLSALDAQREKLAAKVVYDFTDQPPNATVLYRWVDLRPWSHDHRGLRIQADGSDTWESAGICTLHPIVGDFDVTAEFDIVSLNNPRADDQTAIFLQLDATDAGQTQLNSMFNLTESGFKEAMSQLRETSAKGDYTYRQIGEFSARSVSALRMTRRGTKWTTLARITDAAQERILAEVELSDLPISRARLLLHTGGANRQSEILLKKFEIHADEYLLDNPGPAPAQGRKGAVESLLDLFK